MINALVSELMILINHVVLGLAFFDCGLLFNLTVFIALLSAINIDR